MPEIEERLMREVGWIKWRSPRLVFGSKNDGWTEDDRRLLCQFCAVMDDSIDFENINSIPPRITRKLNMIKDAFEPPSKKKGEERGEPNRSALNGLPGTPEEFAQHLKEVHGIEVDCSRCSDYWTSIFDPFDRRVNKWRCTQCQPEPQGKGKI